MVLTPLLTSIVRQVSPPVLCGATLLSDMSPVVWTPDTRTLEQAQLTKFLSRTGLRNFHDLQQWSTNNYPAFTEQVLTFLQLPFHRPYIDIVDTSRGLPWTRWCTGGGLNIADVVALHPADRDAVVWEGEEGSTRSLTYGELQHQITSCAAGLRKRGIGRGDAVAIHLPMMPETVVMLMACAHLGAVAVPLFSGYGPAAIESRIRDVEAKLLLTCDAFPRRGTLVPAAQIASKAAARCPTLRDVVVIGRIEEGAFLSGEPHPPERTHAEDPLIVLYTSGTTGKPKGILHSHCGFPVKAAQDMCFGTDVGNGTRICWVTDLGWMMGPWLIYGALTLGATMCLYDGAFDYPGPDRIWAFCERHGVEVLGISPTLVRALAVHGDAPVREHDLSSLRLFASTGEPWNPDPWWWLFETVGRGEKPIINYSGGTEISGGILMSNPLLPIKPCAFSAPCPGIAADVVDEQCRSVTDSVGELVIRKPWIGMARGFFGDPERYLETYWSRWPDVWAHGDWAKRDDDNHWFILGRSDDTLKIAGKRVGPAEVESILVGHDAVAEAAVIGIPHTLKGECMVAFCVLTPGGGISAAQLQHELRNLVGTQLGKPLRPEAVHFVDALPKTRNAKVMRRVIRAAYTGGDAGDISALESTGAIEAIRAAGRKEEQ